MKLRSLLAILLPGLSVLALVLWQRSHIFAEPTVLSFRIGQSFEEVVNASSYPVRERSNVPTHAYLEAGQTFVTEPAVVLLFNDLQHGFTLPPTKFAMVGYMHNKVDTVATSPMLEKQPFEQAVTIIEELQNQFKAGGWEPWTQDGSVWFDLTPDGKKRLYARLFKPGFSHETTLRVPGKYAMTFRIWCAEGCMTRRPPYLFLVDVGISSDGYASIPTNSEPMEPRTY